MADQLDDARGPEQPAGEGEDGPGGDRVGIVAVITGASAGETTLAGASSKVP